MFALHRAEIQVGQCLLNNALALASDSSSRRFLNKMLEGVYTDENEHCVFNDQINLLFQKLGNGNGKEKKK